jgi:hypothetical protein
MNDLNTKSTARVIRFDIKAYSFTILNFKTTVSSWINNVLDKYAASILPNATGFAAQGIIITLQSNQFLWRCFVSYLSIKELIKN